ncbi:hypothetical protein NDU88_002454 [Pleurodeles waltl]|uniref:Uncharacterized protein n=1 Tax=Pleurodeles waltl TaxID=8319 RepID=A0AAV7KS96_PLEWA|nr:hypothetical protein NDU88_002454 [Pleurodeles waltl]
MPSGRRSVTWPQWSPPGSAHEERPSRLVTGEKHRRRAMMEAGLLDRAGREPCRRSWAGLGHCTLTTPDAV